MKKIFLILILIFTFSCNVSKEEKDKRVLLNEVKKINKNRNPTKEQINILLEKSKELYQNGDEKTAKQVWENLEEYTSEATLYLADYYDNNKDEINYEKYLLKAAEKENETAMFNLGGLYQKRGNTEKMLKWYTKVIEKDGKNSAIVMTNLGNYYDLEGQKDKMLEWYKKAAEKGSMEAMNNLGVYYSENNQEKEMLFWYKKALEKDENIRTLNNFKKGNLKEAEKWYKRSADKGSIEAMNDLGVIYDSQKRYELAIKMFLKAAENGDEDAVLNIGLMYEDRDMYNEAKEWYKKFAELGNQKALKKYNELKDKY